MLYNVVYDMDVRTGENGTRHVFLGKLDRLTLYELSEDNDKLLMLDDVRNHLKELDLSQYWGSMFWVTSPNADHSYWMVQARIKFGEKEKK